MKLTKINIWDLRILTLLVIIIAVVLAYSGMLFFPVKTVETGVGISFFLAFLGGFFALLSPCSAVVLPAFFTYSFQDKKELLKMTYIFFLGLLVIFIPLGFSTSVISFLFSFFREITFIISGIILIVIGLIKIFDIKLIFINLRYQKRKDNMTAYVFLTGMFFSFTTIACTGPIIGGIATMAAALGFSSTKAILLLIVFVLGLVTPLFILSLLFSRYNVSKSWIMKQKSIKINNKEFKFLPVNIISGLVFLLLGITFIFYENINNLFSISKGNLPNLYLRGTTVVFNYLNKNPMLNSLLSFSLIVSIIAIIWKIVKKNRQNT
jgi:cytochrome c biogenesis protein CcdA